MKSIVINEDKKPEAISYPWLGIANIGEVNRELIVLFIAEATGVVLSSNGFHEQGSYRDDWFMNDFARFEGEIMLKNDYL
jgi:hypothetical protein